MAHKDAGNYGAKHGSGSSLNRSIAQAVGKRAAKGEITCANAFAVADEVHVPPAEVGVSIDLLEIRINKCQLGLFGYGSKKIVVKPANISAELSKAIFDALVNGRLPCMLAWEIAERFDVPKMDVSSACEALKIKIKPCQLGAF